MTRIVVHALHSNGEPRRWTLSERIVAENLESEHYVRQLVERLRWATADAEALESQSTELTSDQDGDGERLRPSIRSRGPNTAGGFGSRPRAGDRRVRV